MYRLGARHTNTLLMSESENLGISEASFSKFVLCTNNYFVGILSHSYIHISLMNAQKHIFGMYVFVCSDL